VAGQPGLGKSQITIYLAAITSRGAAWTTNDVCAAGDVLIFSAEDDPADTIRPRLEACGANLDRVHIVEAVRHKQSERTFNLKLDLDPLARRLTVIPGAKVVIIDPITAYLGDVHSDNNSDVRGVLAPLAKLAADHGVAVVCVTHLNKGTSTDPLTRVIGSTAFGAAVRTAFIITPDKASPDRRLFLPAKSNISRNCDGLAFRVESHTLPSGIETSRVVWEAGSVKITASEALSWPTQEQIDKGIEVAEACLRVFVKENAAELRASILIDLLKKHENRNVATTLKGSLKDVGIVQDRRTDANYYLKADFVTRLKS
jgi:putative DNA primase/helicase